MPKIAVLDMQGKELEKIDLPDSIFGIEPNQDVMHDVVVNYLANRRQGTQSALTRAEVSGGGKKPWRQKGTGHARQGSIRAPQWRHGGIVFAPKPRDYSYVLNKKVKRLALKSAFSSKFLSNNIIVLNNIEINEYKTRIIKNMLDNIGINGKSLMVLPDLNNMIIKSSRNIPGVKTSQINNLNVYDILDAKNLIILKDAVSKIEEVYA